MNRFQNESEFGIFIFFFHIFLLYSFFRLHGPPQETNHGLLVRFYVISTFVRYSTLNPFCGNSSISNNSVYYEYKLYMSKTFLFQFIHFNQTILIQLIQFRDFVNTCTIPMIRICEMYIECS